MHQTLDALAEQIDYRPQTLVWNAEYHRLDTLRNGTADSIDFSRLIVATGATDRILPVPGWTLPGVYSLGAAQIALKYQGCAIGESVVFCGSGRCCIWWPINTPRLARTWWRCSTARRFRPNARRCLRC